MAIIITHELLAAQIEAINEIRNGNMTWQELNELRADHGIKEHKDTTAKGCKILMDYMEAGWIAPPNKTQDKTLKSITINSNGTVTSEKHIETDDPELLKDPSFLLKQHKYDPLQWKIVSSKSSMWSHGSGEGDLYSSQITVKPIADAIGQNDIKEIITELTNEYTPVNYEPKNYEHGQSCLVPCLFDLHFAKLAHYSETLHEYNFQIAEQRFVDSIISYIERIKDRKFEKIIFPIGNDFFNSEATGNTFAGTRQDNDLRYGEMFKRGIFALVRSIDYLRQVAPVKVLLVQGNHDFTTSFYASCVLEAYYKDDKYVDVDTSIITRKYEKFGSCLLGFTHGGEEGDKIYSLMQMEVPNMWGETKYREWLTGHSHHEIVKEKNGVTKRSVPALCAPDAWHYKKGFVGSLQRSACYIYDKTKGLTDVMYINYD